MDIEKAYDKVEWNFLMDTMVQMGFGRKWLMWIRACLESASVSILINGSPTKEIKMSRGVRQGDPLAPFLFLLVAEGLNQSCKMALEKGLVKGVEVGKDKIKVFHLQYADDMLVFGQWGKQNIKNIPLLFKCFYLASGLKVNLNKSCVYGLGVARKEVEDIAVVAGCQAGSFPLKYVGLPIGCNMNKQVNWYPVVEKFKNTLSKWKMDSLSFGGRLTLVKTVLGSLALYFFSLFRAPVSVIKTLERIRANFFWGGGLESSKVSWVSWQNTIASHELGGLNIGSLRSQNLSLLEKWWWRFHKEEGSLWVWVIKSVYGPGGGLGVDDKVKAGSTWGNIIRPGQSIEKMGISWVVSFVKRVGNGHQTSFWFDKWVGNFRLCNQFPRLFKLESIESTSVYDKGYISCDGSWVWN